MKKAITIMLALMMLIGTTACGKKDEEKSSSVKEESSVIDETSEEISTDESSEEISTDESSEDSAQDESSEENSSEAENNSDNTLGQTLLQDFRDRVAADENATAQAIADGLITNSAILFAPLTMPVEQGLLSGFDNAEIKGFKEGVMFGPAMGSIAFVGYIFELDEATDADEFIKTLQDNANPRWNICVEAEETVVDKQGNKVFFLMCPKSLEA